MSSHTLTDLPPTMRALVVESKGKATVKSVPLPKLSVENSEVLVRVRSVALNPTDWKFIYYLATPGAVMGCDFAGEVVAIAGSENGLKVGDRVAGFVSPWVGQGVRGSFAEFVHTPSKLVWKIPISVSFDEAAAIGIASETAVLALYIRGHLPPPGTAPSNEPNWVMIYGGSTSVGQYAVQLAHASGLKVVTTASPRNHALLKGFGADEVFDYKDPETPAKIREVTSNSIAFAADCVSEGSSFGIILDSVKGRGCKVVNLLSAPTEIVEKASARDITFEWVVVSTTRGEEFSFGTTVFEKNPINSSGMEKWLKDTHPALVGSGALKSNTIKLWEGGLEEIPQGLEYLKAGKVSAEKVVFRI